MRRIYIDHNSTTPLHPDVLEAMLPYYRDDFGNASSVHYFGRQARQAVEEARRKVASLIGADGDEVIFTSGGSESDNLAIRGAAYQLRHKGNHIITSSVEHLAVLAPCKRLEKEGFRVTYLPVDPYGVVDIDALKQAITKETILISVMTANNEVGTIQPIAEVGKIAKENRILFHTDAIQAAGKIEVDVNILGVDMLSLSAHKIYGPKGVGALYLRKRTRIEPLILGGHHEKNLRAGTENVAGIAGFGKAAEIALSEMEYQSRTLMALRDMLYEGLLKNIDDIKLNGHPTQRLPNTLNVSFEYLEGESIILSLDLEGIAVSTGSACTSGSLEPSHVLLAMGVRPQTSQGSIRFSLGRVNTEEDIDYVIRILPGIIERLRSMSPLYEKKR